MQKAQKNERKLKAVEKYASNYKERNGFIKRGGLTTVVLRNVVFNKRGFLQITILDTSKKISSLSFNVMTNQDNKQEPVSFSRVLLCQYGGTLEQHIIVCKIAAWPPPSPM